MWQNQFFPVKNKLAELQVNGLFGRAKVRTQVQTVVHLFYKME